MPYSTTFNAYATWSFSVLNNGSQSGVAVAQNVPFAISLGGICSNIVVTIADCITWVVRCNPDGTVIRVDQLGNTTNLTLSNPEEIWAIQGHGGSSPSFIITATY